MAAKKKETAKKRKEDRINNSFLEGAIPNPCKIKPKPEDQKKK